MRFLGLVIIALGLITIGIGGPFQQCASETDTNQSSCNKPPPDCGQCYVDSWTDYYCPVNITTYCHLDTGIQITVTRRWYECTLKMGGNCSCEGSFSHQETYQWSGGESCFTSEL
jgi:hypothetical protein